MPKPNHTPKIEERVWDYKKMTAKLYAEPDIVEEFDPDNEDMTPTTNIYTGYEYD